VDGSRPPLKFMRSPALLVFAAGCTVVAVAQPNGGNAHAVGRDARFGLPTSVAVDWSVHESGSAFVLHATTLRKVTPSGIVSAVGPLS
jgi:hypothetical protein